MNRERLLNVIKPYVVKITHPKQKELETRYHLNFPNRENGKFSIRVATNPKNHQRLMTLHDKMGKKITSNPNNITTKFVDMGVLEIL